MTDGRFQNVSTLIVKVTHRCNLDCLYCYENISKKGEDMPLETFHLLAEKALSHSSQKEILFLFHGGEPTLLKNEWYEKAIHFALDKAGEQKKRVKFAMQSNLLGLNEAKIALFKRFHINLGISLDGSFELHHSMRGGEDRVFQNFLKIKKAGVQAGILSTINHSNYRQFGDFCQFLVQEARINSFKANVVTPVGRGYNLPPLKAEQVFEAQHAILEFMIRTKGEALLESNLSTEIERFFVGETQRHQMPETLCQEKRCGAGKTVLGVTPEGQILPCGRFQWDDRSYFMGELSSVNSGVFEEKVNHFHQLVPENWYDCDSCEARKVCGYGCQAFIVRSRENANVDCLPTKMRFRFYQENRKSLQPVYRAILQRKNTAPGKINFKIRDEEGKLKTYSLPSPQQAEKKLIFPFRRLFAFR